MNILLVEEFVMGTIEGTLKHSGTGVKVYINIKRNAKKVSNALKNNFKKTK